MMKLTKPLVFFDLETTGVDITKDRIVQIAIRILGLDGGRIEKSMLINPTIAIPKEASEVHGITDEMVKDAPTFKQISSSLFSQIDGFDLAGYNSDNFDIPLLAEEFARCGMDFPKKDTNFIDSLKIERIVNSHKLEHVYNRYTGKKLEGAHDAMEDVRGTFDVLMEQLKIIGEDMTPAQIDEMCQEGNKRVDIAGKLYEKDGEIYWKFGKWKDHKVKDQKGYANWVLGAEFPKNTKDIIRNLIKQ